MGILAPESSLASFLFLLGTILVTLPFLAFHIIALLAVFLLVFIVPTMCVCSPCIIAVFLTSRDRVEKPLPRVSIKPSPSVIETLERVAAEAVEPDP